MTKIIYYITANDDNPTKKFIESLTEKQQRKVAHIFAHINEYGLIPAIPHVKKLTSTPLWEIRILGQDNIRIFYATIVSDSILLLHGFIKKSQKTPAREIQTALKRLADWESAS